jgi:uncharacterized membrane protein
MNETNDVPEENAAAPEEVIEETVDEARVREEGKIAAILSYVPFLCFYALFLKRDNPYAFHHAKLGLLLFIVELAAVALRWDLLWNVVLILCAAVAIWGMVAALRGDTFRLPIISDLLDQYQP